MSTFITVSIPYVNATPHLGYAFELVEADLVARSRRLLGEPVRFLGGTDDYSLKNVLAAEAAQEFVDRHADQFQALGPLLDVSFDDFIRTSSDARHRPAVERLWTACERSGDLYQRQYEGLYCVGCEQFFEQSELDEGRCREHGTPVERATETNWFFRLSRYEDRLIELIESDELLVDPPPFRTEVLSFLRAGLRDISVSRSVERAHGWGLGVPSDPTQVIYVWFDALTNYISSLGFGTTDDDYERWWTNSDERIHVASTPCTGLRSSYPPESRCPHGCTCIRTSTSTGPKSQSLREATPLRPNSLRSSAPKPSAGGVLVTCHRWPTPTSPPSASRRGPTRTSPMESATR
jgi:methionyl-tRNA synthetase